MKKNIAMIKNVPYTSIVEILVCVKCIKSKANRNVSAPATHVFAPNNLLANSYINGSMPIPNNTPIIRQPNGFMPKARTPRLINTFPSGGCVHS